MTAPIEDVSNLPGRKVTDQEEVPIGEVKDVYAMEGDGHPMWVTIEAKFGAGKKRTVFIPLARLKDEDGDLRVPYSKDHIGNTPEVDHSEGISEECERKLRDHYGIDRADQELRSDNDSYATLIPEEGGTAERAEDADKLETPDADKITDETRSRLEETRSAEMRNVTADDVTSGSTGDGDKGEEDKGEEDKGDEDESDRDGSAADD
jgi:hypothetical protein